MPLSLDEEFRSLAIERSTPQMQWASICLLLSADAIADEMIAAIAGDLGGSRDAILLVNGFGGTPAMELYLMYHAARTRLEKRGIRVRRSLVGNYVTSLVMADCSLTVSLLDDEIAGLWDAPLRTPAIRWGM